MGIDLVSVDSVRQSVRVHADHYLHRVYTDGELADCRSGDGFDAERLAARFAAKEAALKVLRPGEVGLSLKAIEVRRTPGGWVELELSGPAAEIAAEAGLRDFALSVSHESGYATAVVVADVDLRNP